MSSEESDTHDVSVLIVGYRSLDLIRGCLESLFRTTQGVACQVLFVDQSDDGSNELVARDFDQVTVVAGRGNLGFAGGVNLLAGQATGRHLLLLNPDVIVGQGSVACLVKYLDEHPACGVAGGLVELMDGRIDAGCLQDPPSLLGQGLALLGRARYRRMEPVARSSDIVPVPTPSGAFLAVRRTDFEAVGGMDESFFLYSEEVDLCRRIAKERGKQVLLVTGARVRHDRGASHDAAGARQLAMWKGKMHFARKHHGGWHTLAMGSLLWTHAWLRWSLGILLGPVRPERAATLRERFAAITRAPRSWWGGYGPLPRE